MISPTVGRRVYYKPFASEREFSSEQPFDAGILHVWSDTCINVMITSANGRQFVKTSCYLVQDGEPQEGQCYWMPYQVKTAAAQ